MKHAAHLFPRLLLQPGLLRPGWLFLAGLLATAPAREPDIVWRLDNPALIADQPTTVLGAPQSTPEGIGFDGVDDGLIVDANPLAEAGDFTVEILLRPDADGPAEQRFFHVEDTRHSRALLETRMLPGGRWALDTFLLSGAERCTLLDRALSHPAGQWHWVALTYADGRMRSYVNGVPELEGAVRFAAMAPGRTSVGVRQTHEYWFKGTIREVRIHRRALPADELQRAR